VNRSLRALIYDETLDLVQRLGPPLEALEATVTIASSRQDLRLALTASRPHDVLIFNVTAETNTWELAEHVRHVNYCGLVLAFVAEGSESRVSHLTALPRVQCLSYPSDDAVYDVLSRLLCDEAMRPSSRAATPSAEASSHGIVGRSPAMMKIFSLIDKVASGDANVCIYGESGTGKELIARAVHRASPRAGRPLVTLDCTAIPEGLMESQLFGHARGAFTGAVEHRDGVFAAAHTGTLFMDELCELSLPLQAKLLRVIQTREFTKVGGNKPISANIRLVTATNKDLKQAVDRGLFREDLYYRVAVIMIKVPALRERREDIPLLVEHFIEKFSTLYQKAIRGVSASTMDRIVASPWPGNVRQLQNFIEQAVVLSEGDVLRERDLFITDSPAPRAVGAPGLQIEPGLPLREVERRYILTTLERVRGSRTQAAKALGISLRALQYKLKAYALDLGSEGERLPGAASSPDPGTPRTRMLWTAQA
jgi:DNA-binding NtrC family response regulator